MRTGIAFLLLWAGLIVQSTVFQIRPLNLVAPNLDVVLVVLIAAFLGPRTAMVLGVMIGLIQDVNFSAFIGLNGFAYGFVGYFAGTVLTQFIQRSVAVVFLTGIVCTFVFDWLTYGMTQLFDVTSYSWHGVMAVSLQQMILDGIVLLLLYPICYRWLGVEHRRRYTPSREGR